MKNTMKKINLEIRKDLINLAGNSLGIRIYNEQIKDKIDYSDKTILVLPDRINRISSSFIQGLFEGIIENIGIVSIPEKISVECKIPNIMEFILENLE